MLAVHLFAVANGSGSTTVFLIRIHIQDADPGGKKTLTVTNPGPPYGSGSNFYNTNPDPHHCQ